MIPGLALVLSAVTSFTLFVVFGLRANRNADATARYEPTREDATAEGPNG